ncbi:MAG: hypothetical protein HKO59_13795, partial [Phycisphaerales bacterium]|nr:hypothetical protein [Phycisphaerales bacterium]
MLRSMVRTMILSTVVTVTTTPALAGDGVLERAMALLATLDEVKISIDAQKATLEEVLPRLDAAHAAPIRADWRALDGIAVSRDDLVDLQLDNVSLATALAALVLQLGDAYDHPQIETHEGMIILTTDEAAAGMRLAEVYDVRDLLRDDTALARLRAATPPIDPPASIPAPDDPAEGDGDDGDGGDDESAGTPPPVRVLTPGERLMTLIADNVDPEAWLEFGGTRASITEHNGLLMVSAPATTHRRFHDVLRRLRRARPTGVTFTAAVVEVVRGDLD